VSTYIRHSCTQCTATWIKAIWTLSIYSTASLWFCSRCTGHQTLVVIITWDRKKSAYPFSLGSKTELISENQSRQSFHVEEAEAYREVLSSRDLAVPGWWLQELCLVLQLMSNTKMPRWFGFSHLFLLCYLKNWALDILLKSRQNFKIFPV